MLRRYALSLRLDKALWQYPCLADDARHDLVPADGHHMQAADAVESLYALDQLQGNLHALLLAVRGGFRGFHAAHQVHRY